MLNMSSSRSEKKNWSHPSIKRQDNFFRFQVFNVFLFILSFENLFTRFFFPFSFVGFLLQGQNHLPNWYARQSPTEKDLFVFFTSIKKFNLILLKHALHACKINSFKNKHFFFAAYFESDFIILSFSLQYIKMLKKCSIVLKPIVQNQSSFWSTTTC